MSLWQTKQWGEMLKKSGQAAEIFLVDGFFVEKRSVGLGEYGLFVMGVAGKEEIPQSLKKLCKQENALFIQVESYKIFGSEEKTGKYYKKFITPYTALIDLSQSEEDILKNMKQKGRYNIRLAGKKGITVQNVEKTEKNIKIFHDLMTETTARDNFSGNTLEYYINFLEILENAKLLIAYKDEIPLAAGIFVFGKEVTLYYYGASTSDRQYTKFMAPYLLQWTAIKQAKEFGSQYYDFLGVAGPGEKNSSLAGVTSFKKKFTSDVRKVSESDIWVNKLVKYFVMQMLKKIKNL